MAQLTDVGYKTFENLSNDQRYFPHEQLYI